MYKKLIKISFFIVLLVKVPCVSATQLITGDDTTSGQTFTFPLSSYIYEPTSDRLFIAAGQETKGESAPFSLAYSGANAVSFGPLIRTVATTIDGKTATNPLLGAQIDHIALMTYNQTYQYLAAVSHAVPGTAYLLHEGVLAHGNTLSLLSTGTLRDAYGNATARIAALASNVSVAYPWRNSAILPTTVQPGMALFAAVTNESGIFGEPGSGIAAAMIQTNTTTKKQFFSQLITATLDRNSHIPAIGSPLTHMENAVVLKNTISWPLYAEGEKKIPHTLPLSKMYIGLRVQAGSQEGAGAHALVGCNGFELDIKQTFSTIDPVLHTLAPLQAITEDSIIAAKKASAEINIYHITTMTTTTLMRYLIVVGGVAPQGTQRTVFAMPLVAETGTLANVTALPNNYYANNGFAMRSLPPATQPGDLYNSLSIPAQVGAGEAPGDITDIFVERDAVFVCTAKSDTDESGIFYSQALFRADGMIKGWTQWKRAFQSKQKTIGGGLDTRTGNVWSLQEAEHKVSVYRTTWQKAQQGAVQFVHEALREVPGGIQGFFEFPAITKSFDHTEHPLALIIATGKNRVVIAQSAHKEQGTLRPVQDMSNYFEQTNGTLEGFSAGVTGIICSGGALADTGPIIAAQIISDGVYAWFVVGGARGVAVLARQDGSGWLMKDGLQSGFGGLSHDMRWVPLGDYKAVRKLLTNEGALYILTQTALERVELSAEQIAKGTRCKRTVLAQGGKLPAGKHTFFSDAIISKKVALLATSSGLVRAGNGADIRAAENADVVGWTPIILPYSVGPVTRLYGISATGIEEDIVQEAPLTSGNIYALNAYIGYNQARIYRLDLNYQGTISDATVVPLFDHQIVDTPSFFLSLGQYRNYFATDGAVFAVSSNKYLENPGHLDFSSLARSFQHLMEGPKIELDAQAHSVGGMVKNSSTGSWMVSGDFGIFVNE